MVEVNASQAQTLDINDSCYDPDGNFTLSQSQNLDGVWARLFPVYSGMPLLALRKEKYVFGRDSQSDFCLNNDELKAHASYKMLSKFHFSIYKETSNGSDLYFLKDLSHNGTYVNGEKVGRNFIVPLANNTEIGVVLKKFKIFMFVQTDSSDDLGPLPSELTERYVMSKLLGRLGSYCFEKDRWKLVETGAMGAVHLAFKRGNCERVAVKVIDKMKLPSNGGEHKDQSEAIQREAKILKSLDHPCVIKILDVIDGDAKTFLILELVEGGELFDKIVDKKKFSEPTGKLYFYQMLLAVQYLHDRNVSHRDLKPENILVTSNEVDETLIKISDFGLSKFIDNASVMRTLCGTPMYLAPEVVATNGMSSYTKAVDLWCLGVILFIMLGGYPPFSNDYQDMKLNDQILKGRYSFPRSHWGLVSNKATDLIKRLLTVDPEKRITVDQALEHAWLQDSDMREKAQALMYPAVAEVNGISGGGPSQILVPISKKRKSTSSATTEGSTSQMDMDAMVPSGKGSKKHRR